MRTYEDDVLLPSQGDNIIRTKDEGFEVNPNGLGHELFTQMKANPDRVAQIDAETGVKETCGEVLQRSIRIACHLKKLGVTSEDIITPCTSNHLNTSPVFYGILFTGAKVASMDPFAPIEDRLKQLALVKPKFIFAIPETVDKLVEMIKKLELKTQIIVFGKTANHIPFDEFLVPLPEEEQNFEPYIANDLFDLVILTFSSGTTGLPKAICLGHYSCLCILARGDRGPIVHLSFTPLVHVSAVLLTCYSAALGHIKVCASGLEPKKTWDYLKKYDINNWILAATDMLGMLKYGRPANLDLPHLKTVMPVGSKLSLGSIRKAREVFKNTAVVIMYALTELHVGLSPDFTTAKGHEEYKNKPLMCGKPMKGAIYKVVDPETEEILGPNQPGELRVQTKLSMLGYYNESCEDRYDDDGFVKTGDIVYYDEDYCFFFVERLKEMLRYKAIATAPTELEGILIEHPSVKIAVVVGIPTDEGDLITAVIVRNDKKVTEKELEDLVASKVDDRKKLRGGVYFLKEEEIPFTASRKVRRRVLTQHILSLKHK